MKKLLTLMTGLNLIIIIIIINILTSFFPFWRVDLSQTKIHSISLATKNIIRNLSDMVTIKVYVTEDLPVEVKPMANNLKIILNEISRINHNRIKVFYYDPSRDDKYKQEAESAGIQPIQFSSIKSDKFEISQGYFGMVLNYGNKKEVVPIAGDINNLEYILISTVRRLTSNSIQSIAIAEEETKIAETKLFRQVVERDYKVIETKFDPNFSIASEAASLVVIGNPGKLDEKGIEEINRWLNLKKSLIVFTGKVSVNSNMQAKLNENNSIETVLKEYGMEIEPKLILDESSAVANFRTQTGMFISQYQYWPLIRPENIDNSIPITSGISTVLLPWVSPIKISGYARPLLKSSQLVELDDNFGNLAPSSSRKIIKTAEKQVVGAINNQKGNVVLIANDEFIKDQFIYNNQQNLALALNIIDYLSSGSDLLTIRSKNIKSSPLVNISDNMKTVIKIANILIPIILLSIIALVVKVVREKNNKRWYVETS